MADRISKEARSRIMAAIGSKATVPELMLRTALYAMGLRGYRLNVKELPGKPDICFPKAKVAIFVDGCFWHGCPSCFRMPKSNGDYWEAKMKANAMRDAKTDVLIALMGWMPVRIWEHEIAADAEACARGILAMMAERCPLGEPIH